MKKKDKIIKISPEKREEIEKAKESYRKMWEEIEPFIKKREIKEYSTTGKWKMFNYEL